MSQQNHTASDTKENKDPVPEVARSNEQDCKKEDSDHDFHFSRLDILPPPKYGGTTQVRNPNVRDYENIRRPSARPNGSTYPRVSSNHFITNRPKTMVEGKAQASAESVIESLERQVQEKRDARRSELEGEEVPEEQIEATLQAEFDEPRKELQRLKDSLRKG
jgi:hypothetical protein